MAEVNKIIVSIQGEIKDLQKKLGTAEAAIKKVGDSAFAMGRRFAVGTAVAGGAMIGLVKTFGNFEESFTTVTTLLNQNDFNKFGENLKAGALDVMQQFGFTVQDTNKALFDAVSAGIAAGEATDFLKEASRLAVGGATTLGIAVDGLTTIINAYGLQVEDTTRISNAFYTAQKFGKTTVGELASTIGTVIPVAKAAGIGFEELLSAMALMTKRGIATDNAATALRGAINALVKPSKEAEKILRSLGVPVGATELKAKGLGTALIKLNEAVAQNGDVLAQAIPNVRAFAGLASLTGDALDEYDTILKEVTTDTTSLDEATQRQMKTVNRQLAILSRQFQVVAIQLGEALLPVFEQVISVLGKFAAWLKSLTKEQKEWIGRILAATTAILALGTAGSFFVGILARVVGGFLSMYKVVSLVITGLKALTLLLVANPIGLIIAAITVAVIGLGIAWKNNFLGMRDVLLGAFYKALLFITGAIEQMLNLAARIPGVGRLLEGAQETIGAVRAGIEERVAGLGKTTPTEKAEQQETLEQKSFEKRITQLKDYLAGVETIEKNSNAQRLDGARKLGEAVKTDMVDALATGQDAIVVGATTFADKFKRILIEEALDPVASAAENFAKVLLNMIPKLSPFGFLGGLFGFQTGSEYVPRDMVAQVHKGEMIIPKIEADKLRQGESLTNVTNNNTITIQAGDKSPRALAEELMPYLDSPYVRNRRGTVGAI